MDMRGLKNFLILAKNKVNAQLKLNKTKDIKYSESKYFEAMSFLSIFNCCAEDGTQTMNFIDDVPSADALLQQLKKLEFDDVEDQYQKLSNC